MNLLDKDKGVKLLPWRGTGKSKRKEKMPGDYPTTKRQLSNCVQSVWMKKGRSPYVRMNIAHKKRPIYKRIRRDKGAKNIRNFDMERPNTGKRNYLYRMANWYSSQSCKSWRFN